MSFAYMKHPVIAWHTSHISVVVSSLLLKYRISYDFDEKFRSLILKNVVASSVVLRAPTIKGDFIRYSYLYPYIFESRTHPFFESTCPELYTQQSWEWSDAYSWRNDLWKVNFKRVCKKPTGVVIVIWSGFLAPTRSFSKGGPHHFPKAHALRYGHRKFGNHRMYIRGEWAFRRWHWIKFQWYRLGCLGWFQMDFWLQSVHFRRRTPTIFRQRMPSGMGTESLGMIGCIFAENGP